MRPRDNLRLSPGGADVNRRDICDRTPLAAAIVCKQTGEALRIFRSFVRTEGDCFLPKMFGDFLCSSHKFKMAAAQLWRGPVHTDVCSC